MKRILSLVVVLTLAVLMTATVSCAPEAPPETTPPEEPTEEEEAIAPEPPEVIRWRFHSPHTEGRQDYDCDKEWCDMVTEATDGRLKVTIYPSGALGFEEADMLRICGDGVVEAFSAYNGYYTRDDPAIGMLVPCGCAIFVSKAEAMDMLPVSDELNRESLVSGTFLFLVPFSNRACYYGVCSTTPVNTLESMKGVKIRCWDVLQADTFRELGIPGEILSLQDVYLGIKTGMLDATLGAPEHMLALSMYEVADYYSVLGALTATQMMAVNKDVFQALPADIQDIVLQVSKEHEQKWIVETMKCTTDEEALVTLEEVGMTILPEFSEEDRIAISNIAMEVWKERAEEFGAKAAEYQQKMEAELLRLRGA